MAVTDSTPPPSRWTLRTIRATLEIFSEMTLSGVWRALERRFGIALRSGVVQHYSPDPEYATKYEYLNKCLNEAASMPGRPGLPRRDGLHPLARAGARLGGHGARAAAPD